MNQNAQARLQQIIANHPKGGGAAKASTSTTASAAPPIVNFQDWLFFGTGPSVFINVGIVPTAPNISISYAVVVLQTPGGDIITDASVGADTTQGGWPINLAADCRIYDIGTYGNQLEAWAFAQANVNGQYVDQYSPVMTYTVQP
jgi:hypothetical protein